LENDINPSDVVIIDDDKLLNVLLKNLKDRLVLTDTYTDLNDIKDVTSLTKRILKQRFEIAGKIK
jgi:hypothetical protein